VTSKHGHLDRRTWVVLPMSPGRAAHTVHREAHGLVAQKIHEVKEGS
jgi:hypothetical protein